MILRLLTPVCIYAALAAGLSPCHYLPQLAVPVS